MSADCLVIGCGYLGLRVARLWKQAGDTVRVTTRKADRAKALRREGFEPVVCDVLDPASLAPLADHVNRAVYAVGIDRAAGASMRQVYVDGLANVLERLTHVQRMVYVSSTSVYGQTDGSLVTEQSPTEPIEDSGQVVLEAETLLRERHPAAIVLRFAGMYGPGRLLREQAIRAGQPLAVDPDKWLNLIHIDDGAALVDGAMHRAARGTITNVSDGHPVTRRDYYAELARVLNAPPPNFVPVVDGASDRVNRRIDNTKLLHWYTPTIVDYHSGLARSLN